jgi:beta-glucosidase
MATRAVVAALLSLGVGAAARAETGYDLWLRYVPVEDAAQRTAYRRLAAAIVVQETSPTARVARAELERGLSGLLGVPVPAAPTVSAGGAIVVGTPAGSPLVAALGGEKELARLGDEGYLIRSTRIGPHAATVVAARGPVGALYGAFHLLRLIQTGRPIAALDVAERPRLALRLLDHWDNLDGTIERGYAGRSLWAWDELPGRIDPRVIDYARANASIGVNGTVINSVNADPASLSAPYLEKAAALAGALRPYGLRVYLSANFAAPKRLGGLATADPLDPGVGRWWRDKADEIYRLIPDFGGFLVKANSEGQPGPQDYGRTHADGANVLADALAPHGGVVMWRAFVYDAHVDADRVKRAYAEFAPLDGRFRQNVLVQVKNGPLDFQPREPFHPLYGAMPRTPLMAELQITQEYLGQSNHLVYLAPMWKEFLDADTYAKGPGSSVARVVDGTLEGQGHARTGIAGVANTGRDTNWCGHDFAQANWYAFGRLAWDPGLGADAIADEWIRMTWGGAPEVVATIREMMLASREAFVDYTMPLGLHHLIGGDHYAPMPENTDPRRPDWSATYYHRADASGIGYDRTRSGSGAVDQYRPPLREQWSDPATVPEKLLLWFHHAAWDRALESGRTLWQELIAHYRRGAEAARGFAATWEARAGQVDAERHRAVLEKLRRQAADAAAWAEKALRYFQSFSGRPLPEAARAGADDPAPASLEARAADLVSRMTVDEKVSQLVNAAPAIPRLGIPAYEWWNECLHGVARAGAATVFPQAIGMAASFDPALMREVASAIGDEARAKHHEFVRRGQRGRYQGLTFWSPNINIFRDPRWGRGQETYGEDPYLTARMGVEFVKGLQGDDPRYLKVVATAKHFAVHSGPEPDRHRFDARPSERDLFETYLPAFRALVKEGKVASVMGAYNRVNGESASASPRLLQHILRTEWGFDGYVVSDCGAIDDVYQGHQIVATREAAAALGVKNGCDLECGNVYRSLPAALAQGLVAEKDVDAAVRRLMLARLRLGMFDPPERVPYAQIPYSVNQSAEHDRLARKMAQESIVLLKNDGVLPLSRELKTIAVVGPNADDVMTLLGNYYGTPAKPVTVLAGIRNAAGPGTRVVYARGADLVEGRADPRSVPAIDTAFLRAGAGDAPAGLRGEYFRGRDLQGPAMLSRVDATVDFRWDRGSPTSDLVARGEVPADRAIPDDDFSARWTGQLRPPVSGRYELTVTGDDGFRLDVDGRRVIDEWTITPRSRAKSASLDLEAGRAYDVRLEYFEATRDAEIRLGWRPPGAREPFDEALDAAKSADVVVFVGGLTGDVEGEEMRVSFPGFAGGDRTDIGLPATQDRLLRALHATGKPVVLVLLAGSAIAVEWAQASLPAILVGWYPGQQGGNAVADVLFGAVSPAGRLPVTFYRSVAQLPPFADYDMKGRTYRYFAGEPLYPFGHGLSYTRFEYSDLRIDRTEAGPGDLVNVSLAVRNAGARPGDEVVQLYARAVAPTLPMPIKQLRGFERVSLAPGEQHRVSFRLTPAGDLARYDEARKSFVVEPGDYELQIGASSRDIRLRGLVRAR